LKKSELLYEGKAKKLYKTDDSKVLWVEYLNQATALNGLRKDLLQIKELTLEINRALIEIFEAVGIELIDFKLEFGRQTDGTIILADEISPDTCRLWDSQTRERLDKDIYRKNLGELVPVYQEVLDRLEKKLQSEEK